MSVKIKSASGNPNTIRLFITGYKAGNLVFTGNTEYSLLVNIDSKVENDIFDAFQLTEYEGFHSLTFDDIEYTFQQQLYVAIVSALVEYITDVAVNS